jgi:hypothetical protein
MRRPTHRQKTTQTTTQNYGVRTETLNTGGAYLLNHWLIWSDIHNLFCNSVLFGYCNCEIRFRLSGYVRNSYVAAQNKQSTDVCMCVCVYVYATVLLTVLKVTHERMNGLAIINTYWKPGPIQKVWIYFTKFLVYTVHRPTVYFLKTYCIRNNNTVYWTISDYTNRSTFPAE